MEAPSVFGTRVHQHRQSSASLVAVATKGEHVVEVERDPALFERLHVSMTRAQATEHSFHLWFTLRHTEEMVVRLGFALVRDVELLEDTMRSTEKEALGCKEGRRLACELNGEGVIHCFHD
jgi:hypothetical protein